MPEVNGRELAEAAPVMRPDVGVVFMPGSTDDEVLLRGVLAADVALVMKPFTAESSSMRIRQALDAQKSGNQEARAP